MKNRMIFITTLVLFVLTVGSASATELNETNTARFNYNLRLITAGANHFHSENGRLPESVSDLYYGGWIPGNMQNPFEGGSINYDGYSMNPGDIAISPGEDLKLTISCYMPWNDYISNELDLASCSSSNKTGADLIMFGYWGRVHIAFSSYWNEYDMLPQSIDDMINAGYWPFDGSETNPFTQEPLSFFSTNTGDLNFKFDFDEVRCTVHYDNDRVGAASLSLETAAEMP